MPSRFIYHAQDLAFLIFHSWLKLRWTPSSKTWLMRLDRTIRSRISHKNSADWVQVNHGGKVLDIWTVKVEGDVQGSVPLVIMHGMGGGANMFLNNIDDLAEQRDVILLDLPGFGLSSRPDLRVKYENGWWVDTSADDVEEFYTEVLEQWFQKLCLDKVILLGHSYGGYLSSVYCLKYPDRVKHLILADPWGFPQRPAAADMRPFMRNKALVLLSKLYGKMNIFTPLRVLGPLALPLFRICKLGLKTLFIVKLSGSTEDSADLIERQKLLRQDGLHVFPNTTMQDYCYMWMMHSQSGEVGFSRVSIPFGWARKPLVERVQAWDSKLDVTFIYGARSWIDSQPGLETKNQRHDNYVDVHIISGAGHHVYADRPKAFNHIVQMIGEAIDESRRPNISHEFEQRHLAMSSLRRRSSCASQAELLNDEAGIRQPRALSAHELAEMVESDSQSSNEEDNVGTSGRVMFSLDDVPAEKEHKTQTVLSGLEELSMRRERKSSFRSQPAAVMKNVKFSTEDNNEGSQRSEFQTD
ncbi:1-acylglycerol-3-phosphate O-acyltransferase ABHD5-like isoform X2 [Biomphalaria glabrata]|uniref:1-acylglycerol-3-phosphate O-acyltransferase ABHD5-like isoform X2 n=1 Tax=Biomphalaria glabrata TaxID=6526 RepID=A0A2C9KGR2_BIOGL|nr:1-acylglycerol-3-phosphate O-acyltransferase ABHD5-like isoform X2 [Biomphalaria glabrata]XP_055891722.1 1-acylglycerol-3-phosphate O-acyltransferase ABHD5-like isoform X2 [Biomphalaria glabrata]